MEKSLALAILLAFATLSGLFLNNRSNNEISFNQWTATYSVQFDESQIVYRQIIYEKNLILISKHNSDPSQTYKMGVNQFTAYTEQEFIARFLGQFSQKQNYKIQIQDQENIPNIDIDWTTKGAVSRVKNQGQCGSCWAFSAVASCQSWALLEKKTADLSQQQLVDCSGSYGNHGCNGGSREGGLKYIKDHGIQSESAYPYKAVTQSCKKQGGSFKISTISSSSGCTGIVNALEGRPVSVAVDAGGWSHYSSGVFSNCGKNINHAVLLVGVINGVWKIKNSWGTSWGEKGFIRLASGDTCGICAEGAVWPH